MQLLVVLPSFLLFAYVGFPSVRGELSRTRPTKHGKVKGELLQAGHTTAEVYKSIPFAEPPIGLHRFQRAKKIEDWDGVHDARKSHSNCIQFWFHFESHEQQNQSEDCLYLSVYIPHPSVPNKRLPVLVWLHGGSYTVGGISSFPPESIVKNLVSRGIVVVLVAYRLGPLGYLSMLNESCPGNLGLSDQIMALEWVRDNIAQFNGDPSQVTLAGNSAGASSAAILAVSPKAKYLFHQLMLRSGSSLSPWAVRSQSTDFNSLQIITSMGCYHENVERTMRCLQDTDVSAMQNAWRDIAQADLAAFMTPSNLPQDYNHPFFAHTYFTPVIDRFMQKESIIPAYVESLVSEGTAKPLMIGTVSAECTGYGMMVVDGLKNYHASDLVDMDSLVPRLSYRNVEQVQDAARRKYFPTFTSLNSTLGIDTTIQIASDQSFVTPSLKEAIMYADKGADVFLYSFNVTHKSTQSQYASYGLLNFTLAPHGADMLYLLETTKAIDGNIRELNFTAQDRRWIGHLADHITNFVKHGHPASDKKWPKFKNYDWSRTKVYTWDESTKVNSQRKLRATHTFWAEVVPALDGAMFRRSPVKTCEDPVIPTVFGPIGRRYKYPFFIAVVSCAVLLLTTCGLAVVHFGRNKNISAV